MRVAYVTHQFPLLSETFVLYEILELERRGFRIEIAAQHDPGEQVVHPEARKLRERTLYFYRSNPVRLLYALAWLATAAARLLRAMASMGRIGLLGPFTRALPLAFALRKRDVDHLHAHFAGDATEVAMACAALLDLPYSFTAHAQDIFVDPRALPEKFARAAFAVTVCEYNRRHLVEWLGERRDHIQMVVCCVDPERFRRKIPYEKGNPPTIAAVGRFVEKKGYEYLIDAMGLLRARGVDAKLTIIGRGPLERALKERVERAGVADRVTFTGALPHAEVYEQLERSTLFCLPFVVAEGGDRDSMPVVVKEAMAMEVPIVSTREVGVPEMVLPGTGELVPPRDAEALADALERMLGKTEEELRAIGVLRREVAKLGALFVRFGRTRPGATVPDVDPTH